MELIKHPLETLAMARLAIGRRDLNKMIEVMPPDKKFCYEILVNVSRSFAAVIMELQDELRDAVCIFYLALRGLDTVEDDMKYPLEKKIPMLHAFHEKLFDKEFRMTGCGEHHYKALLENFFKVNSVFLGLKPMYQKVIADITKRMGDGMVIFLQREVVSEADWDEYCHYVAGLVGIGLTDLFVTSNLQPSGLEKDSRLSNEMGLFLQKVNIIRDYREDIDEARMFWPRAVWGKYAQRLDEFKDPARIRPAVHCLNELITNALQHAPACLEYMAQLTDRSVFSFCAIPQVMAIATLSACYNNPAVFSSVVKIRRGEAAQLILDATNMPAVRRIFCELARSIEDKIDPSDPSAERTRAICRRIQELTRRDAEAAGVAGAGSTVANVAAWLALAASSAYLLHRHTGLFRASKL